MGPLPFVEGLKITTSSRTIHCILIATVSLSNWNSIGTVPAVPKSLLERQIECCRSRE